MLKNLNKRKNK